MGNTINRGRVKYVTVPDEALKHKWDHLDVIRKARQDLAKKSIAPSSRQLPARPSPDAATTPPIPHRPPVRLRTLSARRPRHAMSR